MPLDGQLSQPHPQPDFFFRRIFANIPAAAAATADSTRMLPQFSLRNCSMDYTWAASVLRTAAFSDSLGPGRTSRYTSPASTRTAAMVNTLKDTTPAARPPS